MQKKYGKEETRLLKCHNNNKLQLLANQQPRKRKQTLYLLVKNIYDKEK